MKWAISTFWQNTVLAVSVLSLTAGAETLRRVEKIDGYSYTVEYRLNENGDLSVKPTHLWTTKGWRPTEQVGTPSDERKESEQPGKTVQIGGKTFSVNFSTVRGFGAQGAAYAKWEGNEWKYLNGAASTQSTSATEAKTLTPQEIERKTIAQFTLNDRALSQVGLTVRETAPFKEDGATVKPDVTISIRPELQDSNHSAAVNVKIGVTGSSSSEGGQVKLGRYTGAQVDTQLDGSYSQEFYANGGGITAGKLHGQTNMPYEITPKTEFRRPFFRRKALQQASQQAQASVKVKMPIKKAALNAMISNAATNGASRANQFLQDSVVEAGQITKLKDDKKLGVHFSSRSSGSEPGHGQIQVSVSQDVEKTREPRPSLTDADKAAMTVFIHEDAVMEGVAPLLAGKSFTLKEALEKICNNDFLKRLDFCQAELDPTLSDTRLIFDRDTPFKVSFRKGQVKLEINAVHEITKGVIAVKGTPFRIEVIYAISPEGLKRVSVTAGPNETAAVKKAEAGHSVTGLFNRAFRSLTDPQELEMILSSYRKAFKEEAKFPQVKVASQAQLSNIKTSGLKPVVTGYMQFSALDAKSENGWLGINSSVAPVEATSAGEFVSIQ